VTESENGHWVGDGHGEHHQGIGYCEWNWRLDWQSGPLAAFRASGGRCKVLVLGLVDALVIAALGKVVCTQQL
jgi:hypothetical protein